MKLKTLLLTVIFLFLLLGGMGCEKEFSNENIQIKDFSYFGCKEKTANNVNGFAAVKGFKSDEYIEYRADADGYLHIKHVNAVFNCCPDTITATSSIDGKKISIVESETNPICDCICNYDLEYKLGPLSNGKYTLIFNRDTNEFLRFTINYNSSLKGKIYIVKLD